MQNKYVTVILPPYNPVKDLQELILVDSTPAPVVRMIDAIINKIKQ